MRVSRSAIGSVMLMSVVSSPCCAPRASPARLGHAGKRALEGEVRGSRSGTAGTCGGTRALARTGGSGCARAPRTSASCASWPSRRSSPRVRSFPRQFFRNGMPKRGEQRPRLVVGPGRRHDADVHALDLLDLRVVDLGEDQLVADAERVVAAAVERLAATPRGSRARAGSARFISRSRNSYIRCPRSVTRQPMAMPSRSLKFAIDFRARVTTRLLPGDRRQLLDRLVEDLRVRDRLADAHVDHDLGDAWAPP